MSLSDETPSRRGGRRAVAGVLGCIGRYMDPLAGTLSAPANCLVALSSLTPFFLPPTHLSHTFPDGC